MNKIQIAPSILSCDFANMERDIRAVDKAGADLIHVDVMDGHFVPNITIGPMVVEHLRKVTRKPLDVHLMIENPERFVGAFMDAGADIVTVHVETDPHVMRTIDVIKSGGKRAGISLNPATSLDTIQYVIKEIDLLLIMTVNPGFGGQKYIAFMEEKIIKARQMIDDSGRDIDLEVDGGIKAENARRVVEAGANVLVMGTEIFHSRDYGDKIREVRSNVEGAER